MKIDVTDALLDIFGDDVEKAKKFARFLIGNHLTLKDILQREINRGLKEIKNKEERYDSK